MIIRKVKSYICPVIEWVKDGAIIPLRNDGWFFISPLGVYISIKQRHLLGMEVRRLGNLQRSLSVIIPESDNMSITVTLPLLLRFQCHITCWRLDEDIERVRVYSNEHFGEEFNIGEIEGHRLSLPQLERK